MFKAGDKVLCIETSCLQDFPEISDFGHEGRIYTVKNDQEPESSQIDIAELGVSAYACRFTLVSETQENLDNSAPKQTGATKHDSGKTQLSILPLPALELEAKVMMFGANKYSRGNYKAGFPYTRLLDAALRHIYAFNEGQDNDPESSLSHLGHARCCLGMLIDTISLGTATDDRTKKDSTK